MIYQNKTKTMTLSLPAYYIVDNTEYAHPDSLEVTFTSSNEQIKTIEQFTVIRQKLGGK